MGVEPYLVLAVLMGVLAQRLARRIDKNSRESYEVPASDLKRFGLQFDNPNEMVTLQRGIPTEENRMTGYRGRTGIHELMTMNSEIAELIVRRQPLNDIKSAAKANGMHELREDGLHKVPRMDATRKSCVSVLHRRLLKPGLERRINLPSTVPECLVRHLLSKALHLSRVRPDSFQAPCLPAKCRP